MLECDIDMCYIFITDIKKQRIKNYKNTKL